MKHIQRQLDTASLRLNFHTIVTRQVRAVQFVHCPCGISFLEKMFILNLRNRSQKH